MPPPSRPSFARDFPSSPALDALVDAFARGDYARVRSDAVAVERDTDDETVKSAARMLVERTRPDPLAVALLGLALLLFVVFATWAILHGKARSRG